MAYKLNTFYYFNFCNYPGMFFNDQWHNKGGQLQSLNAFFLDAGMPLYDCIAAFPWIIMYYHAIIIYYHAISIYLHSCWPVPKKNRVEIPQSRSQMWLMSLNVNPQGCIHKRKRVSSTVNKNCFTSKTVRPQHSCICISAFADARLGYAHYNEEDICKWD